MKNTKDLLEALQPPKFRKGDRVRYTHYLSGLNRRKALIVDFAVYKTTDELSEAVGVKWMPKWVYGFEGMSLIAIESDIELFNRTK